MKNCLDCGAAVTNHYCSFCGQETRLHVPSAREFIHEFVTHYVAIEGKLWKTLRHLILRPGQLTRDFIEGRRQRYVNPLRLFLTFSILFFAVLKLSGTEMINLDDNTTRGKLVASAARVPGPLGEDLRKDMAPDLDKANAAAQHKAKAEDATVDINLRRDYPTLAAKYEKFIAKSPREQQAAMQQAFMHYAPYAIFLLMPVFALYLKLLYLGTGRYYGEHLLFALHSNAFAYFQLMLLVLVGGMLDGFVGFLLALWMVVYLPLAMQRVYGGRPVVNGIRWIVLAFLHILSIGLAIAVAVALGLIN
jgi:hypothetical protein